MPNKRDEDFKVTTLRCEYLLNPKGIDELTPRLSWKMQSSSRNKYQSAYRILAATKRDLLESNEPDLWDSGKVVRPESVQIPYQGKDLVSRQQVFWKVLVWDESENLTESGIANWSMGLLSPNDWSATWIAANPEIIQRDPDARESTRIDPGSPAYFRNVFNVQDNVRRATLYASARGILELYINGQQVTDDIFLPEWTDYNQRIQYRTYEVTDIISSGENAIGAILGDGWFSGYVGWQEKRGQYGLENSLLLQLELELENGKTLTVASDGSWTCNTGPILSSDFMMGEEYDARRQWDGWSTPALAAQDWLKAKPVECPGVPIVAQRSEPVRINETLTPISTTEIKPGTFLFDLGQNIAGWVRIRINEAEGTRIQIRHGERLDEEGQLYTENLRRAKSTDIYICRGNGEEIWEPSFTFHGFQYVEISGLSSTPDSDSVVGCLIQSSTPQTGFFECSRQDINRLWMNALWSQRDNFLSVPTDCPQRDERLGWMGDAQTFLRTATYNMNVAAFFTKWMVDVEDAQTEDGIFPDTAPRLPETEDFDGLDGLGGGAGWADAGIIIPWTIWKVYGDLRMVDSHWSAMVAWLDYLERTNPEGLRTRELGNNYGDWLCVPSDTSFRTHSPLKYLLASAFWAGDASMMAEMARALGKSNEAARFDKMFETIRSAFQKEFINENGHVSVDTQTACLIVLVMNLVPDERRSLVAEQLVENIKRNDWHLTTGFIGIRFLNPILSEMGYNEVAYRLLLTEDYPSWLYPVRHGATTIWERWNGWTEEEGFFNPHMNSLNHYSLGSICEWMYRYMLGIECDYTQPGFRHFLLRPHPGPGIDWVKGHYESIYGKVTSFWQQEENGEFQWSIFIPANTSAQVHIPVTPGQSMLESGEDLKSVSGIEIMESTPQTLICELPSGSYQFTCRKQN